MKKNGFKKYLEENNRFGYKSKEGHIKKNHPEIYEEIINFNQKKFNSCDWKQKLFNYVNDIITPPKCQNENCYSLVNFHKNPARYLNYCSNTCAQKSKEIIQKKKITTQKNHNVSFPSQSKDVRDKIKNTLITNYGVDNPSKSKEIREKRNNSNIKRYGFNNYSKTNNFKEEFKKIRSQKTIENFAAKLNVAPNQIKLLDNNTIRVYDFCDKHNSFDVDKFNIYNRINLGLENICTKCVPISQVQSNKENEIKDFINQELGLDGRKIKLKEISNCVKNNYEIDVYIDKQKLGIEHNGTYYHSTKFKTQRYHLDKTNECEKLGIKLLHVFEDEWINKKEIIKSIIRNQLNLTPNIVYGRKTNVKEIDNKEYKRFVNKNHIQGYAPAKTRIGLYHNNELISVMSFSGKRKILGQNQNEGEFELIRFCHKINTTVVGGIEKLFKYFLKTKKPKKIITYSNRRFYSGEVYKRLGFSFVGETKPNYFYSHKKSYERLHRFQFRKDRLIKEGYNPNKTEEEIMFERGYYKLYDCGSLKFEYKN